MPRLTGRQQAFIDAYLGPARLNATTAAEMAGYQAQKRATVQRIGSENLSKPLIRAAIDARMNASAMGTDEILFRLKEQASGNIWDYIEVAPGGAQRTVWLEELAAAVKIPDKTKADARIAHLLRNEPTEPGWRLALDKSTASGIAISEVRYDSNGMPRVKLCDVQGALALLAKARGLTSDKGLLDVETLDAILDREIERARQLARLELQQILEGAGRGRPGEGSASEE